MIPISYGSSVVVTSCEILERGFVSGAKRFGPIFVVCHLQHRVEPLHLLLKLEPFFRHSGLGGLIDCAPLLGQIAMLQDLRV